ncbi:MULTISPECIES: helix-turn-helix domain-containing protein [Alicyclobacillus]|uniref:Transcriptional regulator, contains XRE-family HTH domain n=1 Tax=Alicyclobacillus vulcanalis TaxID=252246 RepID=A0A1N7PRS2_9BACL|nr:MULTISPECIES: helix-turn-helix transcriptional regulator [Alicyclobacillus]SIT13250.1 Transcriptional regulator, contains XRE-family HTH domain [Alicyclobacillus vulcanalis]
MSDASFPEILRRLREERKLTQADLAGNGISRALISLYESGRRTPTYETLAYLAERLQVTVDIFFGSNNEVVQKAMMTLIHQAEQAERQERWHDALEMWESAHSLCEAYHFTTWDFHINAHRGITLANLERYQCAVETLLPLVVDPRLHDNRDVAYDILRGLALSTRQLGQLRMSETFFRLILHLIGPSDERWIRTHINLASIHELLGEHDQAVRHYVTAAESARRMGHAELEAWAIIGWTTAEMSSGMTEHVSLLLDRAHGLADSQQDAYLLYAVRHNRLVLKRIQRDADAFLRDYAILLSEVPSVEWKARLLEEKIKWSLAVQNWDDAEACLHEALKLPVTTPIRAELLMLGGELYKQRGKWGQAETYWLQAVEAFRACGSQLVNHVLRELQRLPRE